MDVNDVIQKMVVLTRGQAKQYSIAVRVELATRLAPVHGDRVQLQQVMMNLIINSIDALKMWKALGSSRSSRVSWTTGECWYR